MHEKKYLSLKDASLESGLSCSTLRKKVKSGELKASRPTWRLVILREDLDAFMRGGAVQVKVG